MTRDPEIKRRVTRLVNGDFRPDDLTRIFIFLRERSYGVASIREIGDFVAHANERTKGPTTDEVRDFFTHLRLQIPHLREKRLDLSDLPPEFPTALTGNFRRINSATIKRDTGLKRKPAEIALSSALGKFTAQADGRLSLADSLTSDEKKILNCSFAYVVAQPAFTGAGLYRDFCFVLEKNGVLAPDEKLGLKAVRPGIILYAICCMHLTEIVYNVDLKATLLLVDNDGKLNIWAKSECPLNAAETFHVAKPMFSTNLKTKDWCNPNLFAENGPDCQQPIEVTTEQKLILL